jgi:hypothetical protein
MAMKQEGTTREFKIEAVRLPEATRGIKRT